MDLTTFKHKALVETKKAPLISLKVWRKSKKKKKERKKLDILIDKRQRTCSREREGRGKEGKRGREKGFLPFE